MADEVRLPVRLEVVLDSIKTLLGILNNLKPETGEWKELYKLLKSMENEAKSLSMLMAKPFGSLSLFNTAEKSINKIDKALEKAKLTISGIKFSDIQLNATLNLEITKLENELKSIETEVVHFKASLKENLKMSDIWTDLLQVDPSAITHTFDEIVKAVGRKVDTLQRQMETAKQTVTDFQDLLKRAAITKLMFTAKDGPLSIEGLGPEIFSRFFKSNGTFKSGLLEEFYRWMEQNLTLTTDLINRLKDKNSSELRKAFSELDINKILTNVLKKLDEGKKNEADRDLKVTLYELAYRVLLALGDEIERAGTKESSFAARIALATRAILEKKDAIAKETRETLLSKAANSLLENLLNSLRNTLASSNAEFLKMQRVTLTFNSMKMAIVNFMGFNQVLNLTKRAVRDAMTHIQDLDTVMNKISIVTDMSTSDLWQLVDLYSDMAQAYGVSIKGAYEVSQIYYQQGLQTNDVLTLTNETLKLAKISGLDYAATTDYMTTALRGFKMEMLDASVIVDVYSALAAHTAVSSEELAVAMSKTASSMESVGSTFQETSAMIGTMVAVTRESATNIGSALKSIAARYGEMKKDPTTLVDEEGEVLAFNKVDAALQSVGITMKTTDGQFRDFTDVILELSEKWDQLDSVQQRYIATQFAGNRQQSRFLALVSNADLLKQNINVAENSEDTGTILALKALDSIESKLEQVKVAYLQFYTTIGAEDVWKSVLDGIKNFINTLNSLPKLFNKVPIGAIAMIADLVSMIRLVGVKAIEGVAKIWQLVLPLNLPELAGELGTRTADTFIDRLIERITGSKVGQEITNKVAEDAKKAGEDKNLPAGEKKTTESIVKPAETTSAAAVTQTEALNQAAQSTASAMNSTAEAAERVANSTRDASNNVASINLTDLLNNIDTSFVPHLSKMLQWVNFDEENVGKTIEIVFLNCIELAGPLGELLRLALINAGELGIAGLIIGLSNNSGAAAVAAQAGSNVIEALNKGMGVASPSVFAIQAGKFVMLGLAEGMSEAALLALKEALDAGKAVITVMDNELAKTPGGIYTLKANLLESIGALGSTVSAAAKSEMREIVHALNIDKVSLTINDTVLGQIGNNGSVTLSLILDLVKSTAAYELQQKPYELTSSVAKSNELGQIGFNLNNLDSGTWILNTSFREELERKKLEEEARNAERRAKEEDYASRHIRGLQVMALDGDVLAGPKKRSAEQERLLFAGSLKELNRENRETWFPLEKTLPKLPVTEEKLTDKETSEKKPLLTFEERQIKNQENLAWFMDELDQKEYERRNAADKKDYERDPDRYLRRHLEDYDQMVPKKGETEEDAIARNKFISGFNTDLRLYNSLVYPSGTMFWTESSIKTRIERLIAEADEEKEYRDKLKKRSDLTEEEREKALEASWKRSEAQDPKLNEALAILERIYNGEKVPYFVPKVEDITSALSLENLDITSVEAKAEEIKEQVEANPPEVKEELDTTEAKNKSEELKDDIKSEPIELQVKVEESSKDAVKADMDALLEHYQGNRELMYKLMGPGDEASLRSAALHSPNEKVRYLSLLNFKQERDLVNSYNEQIASLTKLKELREEMNNVNKKTDKDAWNEKNEAFLALRRLTQELTGEKLNPSLGVERILEKIDEIVGKKDLILHPKVDAALATTEVLLATELAITTTEANILPVKTKIEADVEQAEAAGKQEGEAHAEAYAEASGGSNSLGGNPPNDGNPPYVGGNIQVPVLTNTDKNVWTTGADGTVQTKESISILLDEVGKVVPAVAAAKDALMQLFETKPPVDFVEAYNKLTGAGESQQATFLAPTDTYSYLAYINQSAPLLLQNVLALIDELIKLGTISKEVGEQTKTALSGMAPNEIAANAQSFKQMLIDTLEMLKTLLSNGLVPETPITLDPNLVTQFETLIEALVKIQAISAETGESLKAEFANATPEELTAKIKELELALLAAKNTGEQTGTALSKIDFNTIGSAIRMLGNISGLTSQAKGAVTALGGAFSLVGAAVKMIKTEMATIPWMAIAMGVMGLINGISLIVETPAEKLERLNKAAEELSNKAKEVKADTNTLDNGIKKYEELKEKRYESEEAADAYNQSVSDLTDKFPELINSFDEAGNAIINEEQMTLMLIDARLRSAQAASDAAKAELLLSEERLKLDLKGAKINPISNEGEGGQNLVDNALLDIVGLITAGNLKWLSTGYSNVSGGLSISDLLYSDLYKDRPDQALLNILDSYASLGYDNSLLTDALNKTINKIAQIKENNNGQLTLEAVVDYYLKYIDDYNSWSEEEKKKNGYLSESEANLFKLLKSITSSFETTDTGDPKVVAITNEINAAIEEYNAILDSDTASADLINDKYKALKDIIDKYREEDTVKTFLKNEGKNIEELGSKVLLLYNDFAEVAANRKETINSELRKFYSESKFMTDNSGLTAILTLNLYSMSEGEQDLETWLNTGEGKVKMQDLVNIAETFWNNLNTYSEERVDDFTSMISNIDRYKKEDFLEFKDIPGFSELNQELNNYVKNRIKTIKLNLIDFSEALRPDWYKMSELQRTDFSAWRLAADTKAETSDDARYLKDVYKYYDSLNEHGFTDNATEYMNNALAYFYDLSTLSSEVRLALYDKIKEYGLSTEDGINKLLAYIRTSETDEDDVGSEYLLGLLESIHNNLALSILAYTTNIVDNWEAQSKTLKSLTSGIDLKDAETIIANASDLGLSFTFDDFITDGDKLVLPAEMALQYWTKFFELQKELSTLWQELFNNAAKTLGSVNEKGEFELFDLTTLTEDTVKLLLDLGVNTKDYIDFTEQDGYKYKSLDAKKRLGEAAKSAYEKTGTLVNNLLRYTEWQAESIEESYLWDEGDYSSLLTHFETDITFEDDLLNLTKSQNKKALHLLHKDNPKVLSAVEKLQGAFDKLISDALSQGIENINLDDYKGLINKAEIQEVIDTGSITDLVKRYAAYAGKSIDETNNLILQAVEKAGEQTDNSVIKDLTFFDENRVLLDRNQLKELANIFDVDFGALIELYGDSFDDITGKATINVQELLAQGIDLTSVKGFHETVQESIDKLFKDLGQNVVNGLKGNLDKDKAKDLLKFATENGIKGLNFTRTADGLKLSVGSAEKLYSIIKDIDAILGEVVFEALKDNLIETNDSFKSVLSTAASMKAGEKFNPTKINQYKEELELVLKILAVRGTSEDESFNFMDNKIPAGQNNPLNYWNNWIEAYLKIGEATRGSNKGFMAYEDFYNIITEMNNLVALTGEAVTLGHDVEGNAIQLDGSLESAAELINKGAGALSATADGTLKIDLKGLGIDFASNAADMNKSVNDGIDLLATTLIDMLDSLISLLEVVVAMLKLGDLDIDTNNTIDLKEIFQVNTDTGAIETNAAGVLLFTKKYKEIASNILSMAESSPDLDAALQAVRVNNHTMKEIFEDAKTGANNLNIDATLYLQLIQAFYQMAISGDYDLDNIAASIQQMLASNSPGDISIDVGNKTFYLTGGVSTVIDWSREDIVNAAEKAFDDFIDSHPEYFDLKDNATIKDKVAQILKLLEDNKFLGESRSELEWLMMLLTGDIKITEGKDKKGKITYTGEYKGKKFTNAEKEVVESVIKLAIEMEEKGLDFNFNSDATVEGYKTIAGAKITLGVNEKGEEVYYYKEKPYNSLDEAIAVVAADGFIGADMAGHQYTIPGEGTFEAKYNSALNIGYSLDLGTGEYVYKNKRFQTKEALFKYVKEVEPLLKTGTWETNVQDGFEIITNSKDGVTIKRNLTTGELFYIVDNITFTDAKTMGEYVAKKKLIESLADAEIELSDTGITAKFVLSGYQVQMLVDTKGNIKYVVNIGGGTFTAWSEAGLKAALATAAKLEGGAITDADLEGTGGSAPAFTYTSNDGLTVTASFNGEVTVGGNQGNLDEVLKVVEAAKASLQSDIDSATSSESVDANLSNVELDATGATVTIKNMPDLATIDGEYTPKAEVEKTEVTTSNVAVSLAAGVTPDVTTAAEAIIKALEDAINGKTITINPNLLYGGNNPEGGAGGTGDGIDTSALTKIAEIISGISADGFVNINTELEKISDEKVIAIGKALDDIKKDKVEDIGKAEDAIKSDKVEDILNAQNAIKSDKVKAIQDALDAIKSDKVAAILSAEEAIGNTHVMAIGSAESEIGHSHVDDIKTAEESIKTTAIDAVADKLNNLTAKITTNDANLTAYVKLNVSSAAKGTLGALAKGRGNALSAGTQSTLMGELGPELVVSNGRYFIVGQHGAEFVDLNKDAIVFNHLQTQRLMQQGGIGSRGTPFTNEVNAVSYAKGNVNGGPAKDDGDFNWSISKYYWANGRQDTLISLGKVSIAAASAAKGMMGPAMASASAALAALKQLRSMWQSLLKATIKDMGGAGGGGGGGKNNEEMNAYLKLLERWYNYLQEIDKLQLSINTKEAERKKIASSLTNRNGKEYYKNLKESLTALNKEVQIYKTLADELDKYLKKRIKEINDKSPFKSLYEFDNEGQFKYKPGAYAKISRLSETDEYGQPAMTAEKLYDYIINTLGIKEELLKYDTSGLLIEEVETDKTDAAGNKIKGLNYEALVQNFYDKMEADRAEVLSLRDAVAEAEQKEYEIEALMNEELKAIEDNQRSVEDNVMEAIVDLREKEIEEAEKSRDALKETNERFITGLQNALDKERTMYENQLSEDDLEQKRRRLGILQRTGGSASEISSLLAEIDSDTKELYFTKLQEQIDLIQEASDKQIEKLETQIELMQELLNYEEEHGLLWSQVSEIMSKSAEEISSFIMSGSDWWNKSPMATKEDMADVVFRAEQWEAYRDDLDKRYEGVIDSLKTIEGGINWEQSDPNYGKTTPLPTNPETQEPENQDPTETGKEPLKSKYRVKYTKDGKTKKTKAYATKEEAKKKAEKLKTTEGVEKVKTVSYTYYVYARLKKDDKTKVYKNKTKSLALKIVKGIEEGSTKEYKKLKDPLMVKASEGKPDGYSTGGLVTKTGPAILHGSSSRPEAVLNAHQTEVLRNDILGNKSTSLVNLLKEFLNTMANTANSNTYSTIDRSKSTSIGSISLNMDVKEIANDYDAKRAGEKAMEEMLRIARKSTTASVRG